MDGELEIKTGGFALYSTLFMIALCTVVFYVSVFYLLLSGSGDLFRYIVLAALTLAFLGLVCYQVLYIRGNRILLGADDLTVLADFPGQRLNDGKSVTVLLEEIGLVYLGTMEDPPVRVCDARYTAVMRHIPFLVVFLKSSGMHVFSTKPYSKAGFRRLLHGLESAGIPIQVDIALLRNGRL
jgi:hypothetical protein